MPKSELLQSVEQERLPNKKHAVTEELITTAQVQGVVTERQTMLESVERYISTGLRQLLTEKLKFEERLLSDIVTAQEQARAKAKKSIHVLHRGFFELRPLDTSLFE